jgi:flagellar basal body-associated protein FliL
MAAEEKKPVPESKKDAAEAPAKKKSRIKVIGMVAGIMILEAAGVYFLVGMSGPKHAAAEVGVQGAEQAAGQEPVEIDLVDDRFQNMQTGHVWMWEIQVVIKTSKKNEPFISSELEKRSAEIKEGIAQIVRRAQYTHLKEPDLITLSRQFTAFCDKVFGHDAQGNSRVDRIMIPKCRGVDIER